MKRDKSGNNFKNGKENGHSVKVVRQGRGPTSPVPKKERHFKAAILAAETT